MNEAEATKVTIDMLGDRLARAENKLNELERRIESECVTQDDLGTLRSDLGRAEHRINTLEVLI